MLLVQKINHSKEGGLVWARPANRFQRVRIIIYLGKNYLKLKGLSSIGRKIEWFRNLKISY